MSLEYFVEKIRKSYYGANVIVSWFSNTMFGLKTNTRIGILERQKLLL